MNPRGYELTDFEWSIIQPLLPNKPRGVARVDDRRDLNGIHWRLRTGSPWADIPERYGPPATCYNRFVRWRKLGVWDRIFEAVSKASDRGTDDRLILDPRPSACGQCQKGAPAAAPYRRNKPLRPLSDISQSLAAARLLHRLAACSIRIRMLAGP
jgi:transposase